MSARRAPRADEPDKMTCPACARRIAGVVARNCAVCRGVGVLHLGAPARARYPAEAVAHAVTTVLTLRAEEDLRVGPKIENYMLAALHNQTVMITRCEKAGLLRPPPAEGDQDPLPEPPPALSPQQLSTTARLIASAITGLPDDPMALLRLSAPPVTVDPYAIVIDGRPPGFSVPGYVNGMSIVNDPPAALDRPTDEHAHNLRAGTRLGEAMFQTTKTARVR